MSDNMNDVLLVGAGYMAKEYAKVLQAMGIHFSVVGRGEAGAGKFFSETGIEAEAGGVSAWLVKHREHLPRFVIDTVQAEFHHDCLMRLMDYKFDRILTEKPGCLTSSDASELAAKAQATENRVYVAYNRRFYASTRTAEKMIEEDGGISSFSFEFTERGFDPERQEVAGWFIGNDTHVMDMAFFLGGFPREIHALAMSNYNSPGKKQTAKFAGCGVSGKGASFSYQADWFAPGRWGVEIMTPKRRLIFRPMEKLQVQDKDSFVIYDAVMNDKLDRLYKPGLYAETEAFLKGEELDRFVTMEEQAEHIKIYEVMLYGNLERSGME